MTGDTILYSAYNQRVEDIRREMLRSEAASIFGVGSVLPRCAKSPSLMDVSSPTRRSARHNL